MLNKEADRTLFTIIPLISSWVLKCADFANLI